MDSAIVLYISVLCLFLSNIIRIRGTTKVGEISKKVQERSKLKWFGHALRREECIGKNDGDAGAGEKKEKKTKAEVVG